MHVWSGFPTGRAAVATAGASVAAAADAVGAGAEAGAAAAAVIGETGDAIAATTGKTNHCEHNKGNVSFNVVLSTLSLKEHPILDDEDCYDTSVFRF